MIHGQPGACSSSANEVKPLCAPIEPNRARELGTCGHGVVRVDVEVSYDTQELYRCSPQLRQANGGPTKQRALQPRLLRRAQRDPLSV